MKKTLALALIGFLFGTTTVYASVLGTQQGGTGIGGANPYSVGDTLYASGATTLSKLNIGNSGDVLTVNGGVPIWLPPSGGSGSWATTSEAYYWSQFQPFYYTGGLAPFLAPTTTVGLQIGGQTLLATSTGNVGIATTTPWALLSVNPNRISGPSFFVGSSTGSGPYFEVNNGGGVQIIGPKTISAGTASTHPLSIIPQTRSDGQPVIYFGIDPNTGEAGSIGVTGSGLNFADRDQVAALQEERAGVTISGTQNGGTTGNTTNTRALYVNPYNYNTYNLDIGAFSTGANTVTIGATQSANRFSIFNQPTITATTSQSVGTTTNLYVGGAPIVSGSALASTSIGLLIDTGTAMSATTNASTTYGLSVYTPSGGLNNYAADFMGGNVGINTAAPAFPLEVIGVETIDKVGTGAGLNVYPYGGAVGNTGLFSVGGSNNAAVVKMYDTSQVQQVQIHGAGVSYFNGGNVGIGTTTPGAKLQVNGAAATSAAGTPILRLDAGITHELDIGSLSAGSFGYYLQAQANNLNPQYPLLLNPLGGNVGIGTTSPNSKLTVSSGGSANAISIQTTSATNNQTRIAFENYGGTDLWQIGNASGGNTTNDFYIYDATNAAIRMLINASGNVGIGTTSPFAKLSVAGDAYIGGNLTATGTISFSGVASNMLVSTNAAGALTTTSTPQVAAIFATSTTATSTFAGGITGPNNFTVQQNSGNVGIGTTSPSQLLSVQGNGLFSGNISAANITATGTLTMANNTAINWLDSTGTSRRSLLVANDNSIYLGVVDTGWGAGTFVRAGTNIDFFTNGASGSFNQAMRINTSGNVGIGTTSPAAKLQIGGGSEVLRLGDGAGDLTVGAQTSAGASTIFNIQNVNSKNKLTIGSATGGDVALQTSSGVSLTVNTITGNVGIGTTTPGTLLSIGNTGANTINISPTATSTFGSGINVLTGCFAVNGTCVGGGAGGSQTPWTSDINAAGFNLNDAGGITATSTIATSTVAASSTSATGFVITDNTLCPMSQDGNCYPYSATTSVQNLSTTTISGIPAANVLEITIQASTTAAASGLWMVFNNDMTANAYYASEIESGGAGNANANLGNAFKMHNNTNKSYSARITIQNRTTGFKKIDYTMTGYDVNSNVSNDYTGGGTWKNNARVTSISFAPTLPSNGDLFQSPVYINVTAHN